MALPVTTVPASSLATGHKRCGGECKELKPLEEFAFKSVATGLRQSRCRQCQAEYNKAYHQEHRERVNPRTHLTNKAQRERLVAAADEVRHTIGCGVCGRTRADGADMVLLPPAQLTGGRTLSAVIRAGWGLERFTALLEATVAHPTGVRCRTCLGRALGYGGALRR